MIEAAYAHRRIDLMSWTVYRDRLAGDPIIFLPVGALEQHGPHLPMGCDAILASAMAARVADALDGLQLPALRYGYKSQARSGGGQLFPGTTSLDGATLTAMVRDILREVARHGERREREQQRCPPQPPVEPAAEQRPGDHQQQRPKA